MRKNSILKKMISTYTVVISFSFIMLALTLSICFESYYIEYSKKVIVNEKSLLYKSAKKYAQGDISLDTLSDELESAAEYLESQFWIVDSNGYIIISTDDLPHEYEHKQLFKSEISQGIKYNEIDNKKKHKVYDSIYGHKTTFIEKSIFLDDGRYFGEIVLFIPEEILTLAIKNFYLIIWLFAIIALILSSIAIYIFTKKNIIKPLEKVNDAAKMIAKGDVSKRIFIDSDDEIGELMESFNYMAEHLEEIDSNKRHFISNVSHEIRTPITSIKGFVSGILDGVIPENKHKHYLEIVFEETDRLIRLVNELLDLSSLDSGKTTLNIKEVNLKPIVDNTICKFEPKIKDKNLRVEIQYNENSLKVLTDEDKLIQVITNLVDNAVKYSNSDGKIRIWTKCKEDKTYVYIYNSGENIDEFHMNKIWERFYRIDKARSSKTSSGLGLAIVRGIICKLNQDIWVENYKDGVIFIFTLDRSKTNI